jgi:hypothetical protein
MLSSSVCLYDAYEYGPWGAEHFRATKIVKNPLLSPIPMSMRASIEIKPMRKESLCKAIKKADIEMQPFSLLLLPLLDF